MRFDTLRTFLLLGWSGAIAAVVCAFGVAMFDPDLRPEPAALATNFAAVVGLLSPHLSLIYEFFLSGQKVRRQQLPRTVGITLMAMCLLYWFVLVGCVWMGIVDRSFSPGGGDGKGHEATIALVTAIAGSLSFLAIKPTIRLFVLASSTDSAEEAPRSDTASAA